MLLFPVSGAIYYPVSHIVGLDYRIQFILSLNFLYNHWWYLLDQRQSSSFVTLSYLIILCKGLPKCLYCSNTDSFASANTAVILLFLGSISFHFVLESGNQPNYTPIIRILLGGGPKAIEFILRELKTPNLTPVPVVIVQGSGKAADILAFAYRWVNFIKCWLSFQVKVKYVKDNYFVIFWVLSFIYVALKLTQYIFLCIAKANSHTSVFLDIRQCMLIIIPIEDN